MFGLGSRRLRVSRAISVRVRESVWSQVWERVKERGTILRAALCLFALLGMSVAVQSWKTTFPYLMGDRVADGISAKIEFERLDQELTLRARSRAMDNVPYTFRNDPKELEQLPGELRAALGAISQADLIEQVPEEVQRAFGLMAPGKKGGRSSLARELFGTDEYEARFAAIKKVLRPEKSNSQRAIDDIVDDFTKFISPLAKYGIINDEDVRKLKLYDRMVRIQPASHALSGLTLGRPTSKEPSSKETLTSSPTNEDVPVPKVRLADQLNDAGERGRAWLSYPSLKPEIRLALCHWLLVQTKPTLTFDSAATSEAQSAAKAALKPIMQRINVGDPLVLPGEKIDLTHLTLLVEEYQESDRRMTLVNRLNRVTVVFVMMLVLASLNGYYIIHNEPRLVRRLSRLIVYLCVLVLTAGVARWLSFSLTRKELIPLLVTVMVLSVAYNQVLATLTAFMLCLILTLSTTANLGHFVVLISSCAAAVIPLRSVSSRLTILSASLFSGVACFLVTCGIEVVQAQSLEGIITWDLIWGAMISALWCLAAGFIATGSLPIIERLFGVVTDLSLLELSDPSHPLLQELVRRAPGTYNHSISVASIAEAAAESIGADGLLVRVGAYFHDVGKMLKPQYFIENVQQGSESRHEHLAPAMSTLIIIGHVKDGVDLAEQHDLPRPLIDFIEQHHGTTLVEYFFHEASKQVEQDPDHRTDAEEATFRYPGPKPQTKEAGVLMLSDAVEGASRTLNDPTPRRIEALVHNIMLKRLLDGQFDESALTLSELRQIETSLVKSLIGIYHGRIRYPEARSA